MARALSISDRRIGVNCALGVALLFSVQAGAHPEFNPTASNRYIKFDLISATQLRVVYTVMYGAAPASAIRRAADTNADGQLDERETSALGERFAGYVARGIDLTVDGKKIEPRFEEPAVGLIGAGVGPEPFSIDLAAHLQLSSAPLHTVRFDDMAASGEEQLGETELRIEESPMTHLTVAHRGSSGSERQTHFVFQGAKFSALEDRSITFQFGASQFAGRAIARSVSKPHAARGLLGLGLAIAAVAAAGWYWQRRSRRLSQRHPEKMN